MSRFVFGPQIGDLMLHAPVAGVPTTPAATPAPAATPKEDVQVAYVGVDSEGHGLIAFHVPQYDVATHHELVAVHVALYPHEGTATPTLPTDPQQAHDDAKAKGLLFTVATAGDATERDVTVDATEAPEGHVTALSILEFAE